MRKPFSVLSVLAAALMLSVPCAADDSITTLPPSVDEPELDLQTSGDYIYVQLTNAEDTTKKAACIEKYTGTETNVVIPETIEGLPVVMLGDQCFGGNHIATRIELPQTLEALGEFTFAECTSLKEFAVAEGNKTFQAAEGILYAEDKTILLRYPAGKQTESFTVPEGVTALGNVAFAYSNKMTSLTLPDSLKTIGKMAFSDCQSLTEITVPVQVENIPDYCFYRCKNLKTADLNNNIKTIGMAAFACTAVSQIDLPTALVTIGEAAFADTPMKNITISSKVTDIGYSAFGFKLAADQSLISGDGFVIRGAAGSAAEQYAKAEENRGAVTFEEIGAPATTEPAASKPAETEPTNEGMSTGRIIGIVVCSVLLAAVVVIAIVSGIRHGKRKPEPESAPEQGSEAQDTKEDAE